MSVTKVREGPAWGVVLSSARGQPWDYFLAFLLCVFQYRIGQLYMISKHSHEQSERGEGVEVVQNEPYEDPEHGSGQFTEKRIYLNKWVSPFPCSLH